jgi:hypothetical protein
MIRPRGAAIATKYGFGLAVWPAAWGDTAIVHDGNAPGAAHTAELHWYPQHSLAVAVLSNGFPLVPPLKGAAAVVSRIVLGVPFPEKKAEPAAPAPPTAAPSASVTPADRARLTGIYELAPQRTFEVTLENGELYVTPRGGGKQPLVFRSGNSYMREADIITFIIEDGVVTGFEANANGNKRVLKKIK